MKILKLLKSIILYALCTCAGTKLSNEYIFVNCAASQGVTICIGRVLCCVVLLADRACVVISDLDRPIT